MQPSAPEVTKPMTTDAGRRTGAREIRLLLCLAGFTGIAFSQQIPKGWREFVSVEGGYIAYFPKSWHVLPPSLPTLYICNFPPSRTVRAVIVPENGAMISIVPPPEGVTSIEQWVRRDSEVTRVQSRNSITLQRAESTAPLRIEEVISLSIEGPDTVSWYFELSGHLLTANLSYWNGDRNAKKHREVLREMVERIRTLRR
jgi:hypothetical protein